MTVELLEGLNPDQRETALHQGHCLALATAGSGKSKTMATKAAIRLREGESVVAVTFTKDAALELRHRIVAAAGPGCQQRLIVGTFHSVDLLMAFPSARRTDFGSRILKDMRSPFKKPWDIVNEGVRRSYIVRALRETGLEEISLEDASRYIEEAKASPGKTDLPDGMADVVELYTGLLQRSGQVDFQDIILKTNAALRDGTLTPLPVSILLVDEFQDTDELQYEWIKHHGMRGVEVTVVGDDDQSIYAFRRALGGEGMERFVKTFNAQRFMLGTNYRCRAEILAAAERLITCNTYRIEKTLFAAKGTGARMQWQPYVDSFAEAKAAGGAADAAYKRGATFAVIARTNRRLDEVESELIFLKVPYRRADGASIFAYPEVQTYGALLRTIAKGDRKADAKDIDMVLSWAGMSESDLDVIHRLFGTAIRVGATEDFTNSGITDTGREIWRSFAKKHTQWSALNQKGHFVLLNEGVREWLEEHIQKPHKARMLEVAKSLYDTRGETLDARLKAIADAERMRSEKNKNPDPRDVSLLTAHGSKGLEFDEAWIIGLEDGVFPSEDSSLEEERRLMFVSITRAKEALYLSASAEKRPSPFVAEAGFNPEQDPAE